MDFSSLLNQSFPIPPHALMAVIALVIGAVQLWGPKGTKNHKVLGYIWVSMMVGVSISGLFIHEIKVWGDFSPIHIMPFVVFYSLWRAIKAARQGDIKRHKSVMKKLYFLALILTGAFTLLPGRVMYGVILGG